MTDGPQVRQRLRCRIAVACSFLAITGLSLRAQNQSNEQVFPQSKAAIEKALKMMQANLAGRLPVLDGFATSDYPLEHYQRGYYQAHVDVAVVPAGTLVRITAKVTAWYSDPAASRSGYQLLPSNGRLEADLLDQLAEQIAKNPEKDKPTDRASSSAPPPTTLAASPATGSVPQGSAGSSSGQAASQTPQARPAPTALPDIPQRGSLSSSMHQSLAAQERASQQAAQPPDSDSGDKKLRAEADVLEEVLKNQSRPKNLVAVKKSGTAIVDRPSLTAKSMFLASMHDEFEMLDFNQDWVHVRISGPSRGWIWRNSLEMPEGIPDTAAHSTPVALGDDLFHVTREETASFPGDWPPLRGKNVKILSVQKNDDTTRESNSQEKLEYAKYLLEKNYPDLAQKQQEVAGIVLIFDSADGGMIAATLATLQQWKAGALSDAALWHNCYFDPPETFTATGSSGTQ